MMHILSFNAENVKKLKVVRITPDGNTIIIGGKNDEGKSSVIETIMFVLGGKKKAPDISVRDGNKSGFGELDLGDMIAKRVVTKTSDTLTLTDKTNGAKFSSPQKMLDKLIGELTFDPLLFATDKAMRSVMMQKVIGLDLDEINAGRKVIYDERTGINRDIKTLEGQLKGYDDLPDDCPTEEVSVVALSEELEKANSVNLSIAYENTSLTGIEVKIRDLNGKIGDLEKQIEECRSEINDQIKMKVEVAVKIKSMKEIDTAPIKAKMESAESQNELYRRAKSLSDLTAKLKTLMESADGKTEDIEMIDRDKDDAVKKAKLPVEGLGYDSEGVTLYDGRPFTQAAKSLQLKIAMAMGAASNPELKVMFVDNGELLDDDNLEIVRDWADKNDYQIWMAKVGTGSEMSIIMEDGEIKPQADKDLFEEEK